MCTSAWLTQANLFLSLSVRTASTLLIIFVGITLFLFFSMRIFDDGRVIQVKRDLSPDVSVSYLFGTFQMNMEIALICAHIILLFPPLDDYEVPCKILSILVHYFFTSVFMFSFLEAIHTYSLVGRVYFGLCIEWATKKVRWSDHFCCLLYMVLLRVRPSTDGLMIIQVAYVVKKNGLFSKRQNVIVGWGIPLGIILFAVAFHWNDYGGNYHCWLRMNTGLLMMQLVPITILVRADLHIRNKYTQFVKQFV